LHFSLTARFNLPKTFVQFIRYCWAFGGIAVSDKNLATGGKGMLVERHVVG
jgi:hypothetical protein